jgi:hypothetical protein
MQMVIFTFRKCYFSPLLLCYLLFLYKKVFRVCRWRFNFQCYFSPLLIRCPRFSSEHEDSDLNFRKCYLFSIATSFFSSTVYCSRSINYCIRALELGTRIVDEGDLKYQFYDYRYCTPDPS